MSEIDTLIDDKISADADFQAELELLTDEERDQALAEKKAELIRTEFAEREEKARKAEEIARNQKIRAEKAEQELKKVAKPATAPEEVKPSENLSSLDLYALMEAKVPREDVEEVMKAAKVLNIPIADALKSPIVKGILSTKEEERKTAEVTNSGASRRAVSKNTGDAILQRAMSGDLPESDDDIKKLSEARLAAKMAALKK